MMKNLMNNFTLSSDVCGGGKIVNRLEITSFQQENNFEPYNKSQFHDTDGIIEDESIEYSSIGSIGTTLTTDFNNNNNSHSIINISNNNNIKEFNESVKKAIEKYKLDAVSEPLLSSNFDDRFSINNNCDDAEWMINRNNRWGFEEDCDYFHDSNIVSSRKPLNKTQIGADDCDYITRKRKRENDDNN